MKFTQDYAEVRVRSARTALRHAALTVLGALPKGAALARPRVHFLYLHHVFRDEEVGFRTILAELSRTHHFVSYSEAVRRVLSGEIDRPYLAVSFDDGLKSCRKAAGILSEFGISAAFFVCPPLVGETDYETIRKFCAEEIHMPPTEFLAWNDIDALLRAGHEVGSHTMTHRTLAALSGDELEEEIVASRDALRERTGEVRHFAWPRGRFRHFSRAGVEAVFRAGYATCASAERGAHVAAPPTAEEFCIRREHVVATWPLSHVKYFLAASSRRATPATSLWPAVLAQEGR